MTKVPFDSLLAEIRANHAKLNACKLHRIDPATYKFGKKLTCLNCGGEIQGTDLMQYLRGYVAAGCDGNEIWPGYDKPKQETSK